MSRAPAGPIAADATALPSAFPPSRPALSIEKASVVRPGATWRWMRTLADVARSVNGAGHQGERDRGADRR